MCCRYAFGLNCRENTCTYIHGVLPPGYFPYRSNVTGHRSPKPAFAAPTNTPEELAAMDLLDYVVDGEGQGNNHPPLNEQDEEGVYRDLDHQ